MIPEVQFRARHPWALLPVEHRVGVDAARAKAELYKAEFRYVRANRVPEFCYPWRLGQELGWMVPSPIDVDLTPLREIEVAPDAQDLGPLAEVVGARELWSRPGAALLVGDAPWLRLHQYRVGGDWHGMFLPNGGGAAEWHLGWDVVIPDGTYLLILPGPQIPGLEVPMGVLDRKAIQRFADGEGMSIAVRPVSPVRILRGDPIARLVLLEAGSLKARATYHPVP